MIRFVVLFLGLCEHFPVSLGITTIHHDKPEESNIAPMANKMNHNTGFLNITLDATERQKRLLPYANFYLRQPFNRGQSQPVYTPIPKYQYESKKVLYRPQSYQETITNPDFYYQSYKKFTPFSESNAIPGPFRPIANTAQPSPIQYIRLSQIPPNKVPDFSAIYDKLAQLKLAQQNYRQPTAIQPPQPSSYVPKSQHQGNINYSSRNRYKFIQPSKTTIETYTATNIDIPVSQEEEYDQSKEDYREPLSIKNYNKVVNVKPFVNFHIAIDIPHISIPQQNYEPMPVRQEKLPTSISAQEYETVPIRKEKPIILFQPKIPVKGHFIQKPVTVIQRKPEQSLEHQGGTRFIQKPVILVQQNPEILNKPDQYEPPKYIQVSEPVYESEPENYNYQSTPKYYENYEPTYATQKYEHFPKNEPAAPNYVYQNAEPVSNTPYQPPTENANVLGQLLKQLQATNTLPENITTDNIDNSIKTLVKILEALKKRKKISKPIVVQDAPAEYDEEENEADVGGHVDDISGIVTQNYPGDTPEGGTPGKPGIDYPALSSIPQTSFNCKTQRYKGFFGDPDTNCQVWHYCDLNGGQASFLCPNGTIFSQVALTCDWWYNVKCSTTAQLYVLNERLYKYIIPLTPKFPEDYSGPLVDKYLALKFQEMEEKMKKEKGKHREKQEKEDKEVQNIDRESSDESTTSLSSTFHEKETLETIEDDNKQ